MLLTLLLITPLLGIFTISTGIFIAFVRGNLISSLQLLLIRSYNIGAQWGGASLPLPLPSPCAVVLFFAPHSRTISHSNPVPLRAKRQNKWALISPPKSYAFISLPLQSKISIRSFIKHFTLAKIITSIVIFIFFFIIRNYIFPEVYYSIKITFLDDMCLEFYILKDLFLGILAIISRFSLIGFVEDLLEVFEATSSEPLKLSLSDRPLTMDQGKEEGGGSIQSTRGQRIEKQVIDDIFLDTIKGEFEGFKFEMSQLSKYLKDRNAMLDGGKISMNSSNTLDLLILLIQDQTKFLNRSLLNRMSWVNVIRPNLPLHVKEELSSIENEIKKLQANNITSNIDKVRYIPDKQKQVKEFFDLTNSYRNKVRKEISKYETVAHISFRNDLPDLYKRKDFKQLINADASKSVKEVVDQDNNLTKKISEIINEKKKK